MSGALLVAAAGNCVAVHGMLCVASTTARTTATSANAALLGHLASVVIIDNRFDFNFPTKKQQQNQGAVPLHYVARLPPVTLQVST